ncbi:MAG: hypothetical protein OEZ05_01970 [Nitrospirota bacterium]|nr:hypothetical protein [Nitrospirota bacterium]MDH5585374.1 hypothetical protein [Nitrospirota bacterium]
MNRICRFCICLSIFLIPTFAWAHGDASHVMGTVTASEEDHVVVKTTKGDSLTLALQPKTVFQQNGIHQKDARPQVGDRLVAEVTKKGLPDNRDWVATGITFSTPKKIH